MTEHETRPGNEDRKTFDEKVGRRETRKLKARGEKYKQVWFGLGMFGLVGWSVAIPTVVLTALGVYLDSKVEGQISWTLTMLFIGIALGCLNAWYWIKRESKEQ
ncbi:MAG: AtpZ/AtpI family protein [Planctomycetota bacterium]|jgi:ATP synthase protein I